AGSVTCFAAIFVATFFITQDSELSLVIACAGMLIEVLPLKDFDNLLIPIALASLAQFLR
ncbi:MAG TPA: phosphatidate cytidylyltransferase, partial [Treponemataceae bacterium]|nr:phosphatidate cytidylyltransferase [Treponemataceae bacterium]